MIILDVNQVEYMTNFLKEKKISQLNYTGNQLVYSILL